MLINMLLIKTIIVNLFNALILKYVILNHFPIEKNDKKPHINVQYKY